MPYVYMVILFGEIGVLTWIYATDPPASSDPLSVNLGWVGLGSMIVLLVYSVARRSRAARSLMRLSYWLHLHIFLALQAMVCVFFHCFHLVVRDAPLSVVNPGMLNLYAVMVVFFSGIFGRYLYSWLPRTIGGVQMEAKEVASELEELGGDYPPEVEALWKGSGAPVGGFFSLIGEDVATRKAMRKLNRMDLPVERKALIARKVRLERRRTVLRKTQGLFRNWIILHRPIAGIMYVLSAVHVILSYMFTPTLGQ